MPKMMVKVDGKFYDVGGLTTSQLKTILDSANEYADELKRGMEAEISELSEAVKATDAYIDGAFLDGVITELEAKTIRVYINTLSSKKAEMDREYLDIFGNVYASAESKAALTSAKQNYDEKFDALIAEIQTAISDGEGTTGEAALIDQRFLEYNQAISLLVSALNSSIDQIATAKDEESYGNMQNEVSGIIEPITTKILAMESEISQSAEEILLRVSKTELTTAMGTVKTDAVTEANLYADGLKDVIDTALGNLQAQANDTDTYIDNAFKDQIITVLEASGIQTYLNQLNTAKASFDSTHAEFILNSYLKSSPRNNLVLAKTNLDSAYSALITSIEDAILDSSATPAESANVDSKFELYSENVSVYNLRVTQATDSIAKEKALEAQNNAGDYTDDLLVPIRQTLTETESSISLLSDAIDLRVTKEVYDAGIIGANNYADGLKLLLDGDINDLTDSVADVNTYIDGTFRDGIIYEAELKKIEGYLLLLAESKNTMDSRYNGIYSNASLTGTPKSDLATAKTNYDSKYATLVTTINNAIADQLVDTTESSGVNTAFTNYNNSIALLGAGLETAIDAISKSKADKALSDAKEYTNGIRDAINITLGTLNSDIEATDSYIEGAFRDGIVSAEEAKRINSYINIIDESKGAYDQRYTELHANPSLGATFKQELQVSKDSYNSAYSELMTTITNAIADGISTQSEALAVDTEFKQFNLASKALTAKIEKALDNIAQNKASQALSDAIDIITPIDNRLKTAEGTLTVMDDAIQAKVSQNDFDLVEGRVASAEGSITVLAGSIESKVESTDFEGNTMMTKINQAADGIQIEGAKLDIRGIVTFDTFDQPTKDIVTKGATSYWMMSSVSALQRNLAGAYNPTTLTFSAKSQTGTQTVVGYLGRFIIQESTDGATFTTKYTSAVNETSKTYTPSTNIKSIKVQMYESGGTVVLLDEQIIPVVSDGATGGTGAAAVVGVLSNDSHVIPTDSAGANGNYSGAASTMSIYVGASDTSASWAVTAIASTGVTGSLTGKVYTVTNMTADVGYIDFTATRSGYSNVTKRFTLAKNKQGIKGETGLQGVPGIEGSQGVPGIKGADGTNYYTWLKYADTPTTGMSDDPTGKTYMGLAHNKTSMSESSVYSDYSWSLIKGETGNQGIPGNPGVDGVTTYTWVKYATSAAGAGMSDDPTGKTYIGLAYNKTTITESTIAGDYTWSLIKGDKGDTGNPGITYYTWIKYADSATGTGISDDPAGKKYIGLAYNKTTATESNTTTDYTWSLIQGSAGTNGTDGKTYYTWIKYADSATGTGLSDSPVGKSYIGLSYNNLSSTESTTASAYEWSLIKGETGAKGDNGQLNLVNNPHVTGTNAGWSGGTYGTETFIDGRTIGVLNLTTTASLMGLSSPFQIEPQKMYEFSVWLKQSVTRTGNYFGLYVSDKNSATIGAYPIDIGTGVKTATLNTNGYFKSSATLTANQWVKYTAYVVPAGIATDDIEMFKNLGEGINNIYQLPSDASIMHMRVLNYFNTAEAPSTLAVAFPMVKEVDVTTLQANKAKNSAIRTGTFVDNWAYTGTTQIDGGKIRAGTVTADQIYVAYLSAIVGDLGTMNSGTINTLQINGTNSQIYFGASGVNFDGRIDYAENSLRFQADSQTYLKVNKGGSNGIPVGANSAIQFYGAGSPFFNFGITAETFAHRYLHAGTVMLKFLNGSGEGVQVRNASDTDYGTLSAKNVNLIGKGVAVGDLQIATGTVSITPVASTYTSINVSFGQTFPSLPRVVASAVTGVPGTPGVAEVSVSNISTTGCTLWIQRSNSVATILNYIAIGL